MEKKALIIFVRDPIPGKVKTRLAKDIGEESAALVYRHLLAHTRKVSVPVNSDKFVFYTDGINKVDLWTISDFEKRPQLGEDLGNRMENAFSDLFAEGWSQIILIGSDCYQLSSKIIEEAFQLLDDNDVVLGPAKDGGYYMIGLKAPAPELFRNKVWSTSEVASQTIADFIRIGLKYELLPELQDVDTVHDLEGELLNLLTENKAP